MGPNVPLESCLGPHLTLMFPQLSLQLTLVPPHLTLMFPQLSLQLTLVPPQLTLVARQLALVARQLT